VQNEKCHYYALGFDVATLQNFIYKHTIGLENVQRNKEKGEFTRCQVT
jgi:hypothetical protein